MMPSDWVVRFAPLISGGGRVLDLACGAGRHARLLSAGGWRVLAVDRDAAAVGALLRSGSESGTASAAIEGLVVDLERDPWPFVAASFDAVVVTRYLHRPLFPRIVEALREEGVLIYETFALGNERYGRPSNPDFLLRPDELLQAFSPALQVVAFEQGLIQVPAEAVIQRICAVRSGIGKVSALPLRG